MNIMKIKISDIQIKNRTRKDLGDIQSLAKDIKKNGLINPITVTNDNILVAGERRLTAVSTNKEEYIYANVVAITEEGSEFSIEYSENEQRLPFTLSEKSSLLAVITPKIGINQHTRVGSKEPTLISREDRRTKLAKTVGFGSSIEAKRVNRIQKKGTRKLIDAVDNKLIKVTAASEEIIKLSPEDQDLAVDTQEEDGDWRVWNMPKQVKEAFLNKKLNFEDAKVFTALKEKNPKRYTGAKLLHMVRDKSKVNFRMKIEKKDKENKRIKTEQEEQDKWINVSISSSNLRKSMSNILEALEIWDNPLALKRAVDKAVKYHNEEKIK